MISIENVNKQYDKTKALDEVTLTLPSTGLVVFKGENGSGKSTLLNIIGGLDRPSLGVVEVDGQNITEFSSAELNKYREEKVAFIFQENDLFESMTARENIEIVGKKYKTQDLAKYFDIEGLLDKKVGELSGGEQRKVAIARAITKNARIVLVDEPTASLDDVSTAKINSFLKKISEQRLVVVVSHDEKFIREYADIVVAFDKGRLVNVEKRKTDFPVNRIITSKNEFDPKRFCSKVLFKNVRRLVRSSLVLLITFFSIILTLSVAAIDYLKLEAGTAINENNAMVTIVKRKDYNGYYQNTDLLTREDIDYLEKNKFTPKSIEIVRNVKTGSQPFTFDIDFGDEDKEIYTTTKTPVYYKWNAGLFDLQFILAESLEEVDCGHKPTLNNEIVVTSYLADLMIRHGLKLIDGTIYKPQGYDELVNSKKEIALGDNQVVITGIKNVSNKILDEEKTNTAFDSEKYSAFMNYIYGHGLKIYVKEAFFSEIKGLSTLYNDDYEFYIDKNRIDKAIFNSNVSTVDGTLVDTLSDDEIIISSELCQKLGLSNEEAIGRIINLDIDDHITLEKKTVGKFLVKAVSADGKIYFTENYLKPYTVDNVQISEVRIYDVNRKDIESILNTYREYRTKYASYTPYRGIVQNIKTDMRTYVIMGGIFSSIFFILSIFLLKNYISNSIDIHKKDISVLKALGVNSKTVNKIFLMETDLIVSGTYFLTFVIFIAFRFFFNFSISSKVGVKIPLIPLNIGAIVGVFIFIFLIGHLIVMLHFKKIEKITPRELLKREGM